MRHSRSFRVSLTIVAVLLVLALFVVLLGYNAKYRRNGLVSFAMDTVVSQYAYGKNATAAMNEVNEALLKYDERMSLFGENSDIMRINASAGTAGVEVAPETAALIEKAVGLSAESEGAFAISIAPITLAWGITSASPRVVPDEERRQLVQLVDDSCITVYGNRVALTKPGMGLDLGGIAKGEACVLAAQVYEQNGVNSALLSIGGNVYARGTKPDGGKWSVGFRDPTRGEGAYIASFGLQDQVVAVSGGYERYFEEDGVRYIHILDPSTGAPAVSDIQSVGVIHEDGGVADFYSTTLFVKGMDAALEYMRQGGTAIVLGGDNRLYVSDSLEGDFEMYGETEGLYSLEYISAEAS